MISNWRDALEGGVQTIFKMGEVQKYQAYSDDSYSTLSMYLRLDEVQFT